MNDMVVASLQHLTSESDQGILPSAYLLLRRAFRIMRGCGISTAHLRDLTTQALSDLEAQPEGNIGSVSAREALACCDVVLKWRRDSRFLDDSGNSRSLSIGTASPNFAELANSTGSGHDADDLLRAMLQLGVARMRSESEVELISESVVVCSGKEGSAKSSEILLEHVCGFLGSVEYNVFEKPSRASGKFERACYAWVPRQHVPVLERLVSNRGQDFVDVIDEWLSRRSIAPTKSGESVLVGAGAYVFVRDRLGS